MASYLAGIHSHTVEIKEKKMSTETNEASQKTKKSALTFDDAIAKIIGTLVNIKNTKKIQNLGLVVNHTGFTVTVDGKVCDRNLKTIKQLNNIVNQITQ